MALNGHNLVCGSDSWSSSKTLQVAGQEDPALRKQGRIVGFWLRAWDLGLEILRSGQ